MTELFFPEERRKEFTTEPWDGVSFRHYRDPKIVCLEHYQPHRRGEGLMMPVQGEDEPVSHDAPTRGEWRQ